MLVPVCKVSQCMSMRARARIKAHTKSCHNSKRSKINKRWQAREQFKALYRSVNQKLQIVYYGSNKCEGQLLDVIIYIV